MHVKWDECTIFWLENLKVREYFEYMSTHGTIILK
jgi:hypothetical protein